MKEITFDGLRWFEAPVRVRILPDETPPRVFFQITGPREVKGLCQGRPVEELPRILSILSPAHHLVSAMALDKLFGVEPPHMAVNMRQALGHTFFFENHLRKIFSLLSSLFNPFSNPVFQENRAEGFPPAPHMLDEIMGHVALAQEAVTILGGRSDHPLTAVVGGVSRYLKEENFERLSQIAKSCLEFSLRLGPFLGREILEKNPSLSELAAFPFSPLPFLTLTETGDTLILKDGRGMESDRFPLDRIFQKIAFHQEPWSYEPFAYYMDRSGGPDLKGVGIHDISLEQCFFVGPLARLNQDTMLTPLAEAERQRLLKKSGPLPRFDLSSALWSLFLEGLQASEKMVDAYQKEKMLGPETRTIPTGMGRQGLAALESPRGIIVHHYTVDGKGLVEDIEVLDTVTANNALRCLLARTAAQFAMSRNHTREELKNDLELMLLPF